MSSELVAKALDRWKRSLLDLSKRNRLLNYKPTRSSTIEIIGERPEHVFSRLREGRGLRFQPGTETLARDEALEDIFDVQTPIPFEPAHRPDDVFDIGTAPGNQGNALESSEGDSWLRATLPSQKLERTLRLLAEQANLVLQEKGINTLSLALGMLEYFESDDSDQKFRAPLILLPVRLERQRAGAPFQLKIGDDEPVLNPGLVEHVVREFGISFTELADIGEGFDPRSVLRDIQNAVSARSRWKVTDSVVLGLFSFQKLVMYKDLERNREKFATNRLLWQMVTGHSNDSEFQSEASGKLSLDEDFRPEDTFQVVDADSSQLHAIAAVSRGKHLVIEGPPGTGKSQTITNLIASALSRGQSVLFVAEKMAALRVVFDRLAAAGLGDFCLEVHSDQANKRAFYKEISRSLDNALTIPSVDGLSIERLRALRSELTGYCTALHTREEPLGLSPYEGYGRLAEVANAPRVKFLRDIAKVSRSDFDDAAAKLAALVSAAKEVGDPALHPWRGTSRTFYGGEDRFALGRQLELLEASCGEFEKLAPLAELECGLRSLTIITDRDQVKDLAELLAQSPGAPFEVLCSSEWNVPPPRAVELVAIGLRSVALKSEAARLFVGEVLDIDHTKDIELVERLYGKPWSMLTSAYRETRRRWRRYRRQGYRGSLRDQVPQMRAVVELRKVLADLASARSEGVGLFGTLWKGAVTDWSEADRYVKWVTEFRALAIRLQVGEEGLRSATTPAVDVSNAMRFVDVAENISRSLATIEALVGWPEGYLRDKPVATIRDRAETLRENIEKWAPWAHYLTSRSAAASTVGGEAVAAFETGELACEDLPRSFEKAFLQKWLDSLVQRRPELLHFHSLDHERRIAEFRALDRGAIERNRTLLVSKLRQELQAHLRELGESPAKRFLRAQVARQRGHAPIRQALHDAYPVIRAIKPCFMMSPVTVAQHLDPERHAFDLVIFDEASQVTPEDAVGAIVRGNQLVVVGDPKQLPPTDFFSIQSGQRDQLLDESGELVIQDMESILDQLIGAGLLTSRLRWHYRSRHESLIAFSNVNFYDSDLFTFPSADTDTRTRGLQFVHVPDGVYEGAGVNRSEARKVAQAVMDHARRRPNESLAVGTFSLRQQVAIQDELEVLRRAEPELEYFFARKTEGEFFVKNLENIQGDDRDVIILSVTYAPGLDGKLRYNFGPINRENGWRRLNVLITRARLRMFVFSSMKGDEIDSSRTSAPGARFLREFLIYAERGSLAGSPVALDVGMESPFEREVFRELTLRGVKLRPQIGVAGYRVDFGVLDEEVEGRYVCGIECDGVSYHSAETARDRDRLREEVLSGLGWTIHRVWSTDWFKDRAGQVERLLRKIDETRHRIKERAELSAGDGPDAIIDPPPITLDISAETAEPAVEPVEPLAAPYQFAEVRPRSTSGVLQALPHAVQEVILEVIGVEAPIHEDDLAGRVAQAFGNRGVGRKIGSRIHWSLQHLAKYGELRTRGEFVWGNSDSFRVRSRQGTDIPAERIPPEEYLEAVLMVLRATKARSRTALLVDVRALFGFARTGSVLEEQIVAAIEAAMAAGLVGEGGGGLGLIR